MLLRILFPHAARANVAHGVKVCAMPETNHPAHAVVKHAARAHALATKLVTRVTEVADTQYRHSDY